MEENHKGHARRALFWALCAAGLFALVVWLWRSGMWEKVNSPKEIRAMIERAGAFAGVVYFLIQLLSVVFAPVPSNVSMLAGALAMGFWPALLLGIAAILLGSLLVFLAARKLGQRHVQRYVDHGVMEKYLPVIREKQDVFLFLALLFPFFPDDMLCILAGLTTMPATRFMLIVLLARPWGLVFAALLGSGVLSLPAWGWAVLIAVLCAAFLLALKYSRQIEDKLLAIISRAEKRDRQ